MSSESNRAQLYVPAERRAGALDLLGVPIDCVDGQGILDYMAGVVAAGRQAVILYANVFGINLAVRDGWMKSCYQRAQMVFCDGDGVRWGCSILGLPVPTKVTYNIWLWELAASCEKNDFSMYLLGSRAGVADLAAANLRVRYPRLRIVGTHDGYFPKEGPQSLAVLEDINRLRPDVLLVCFGMPVQERWVFENVSRLAAHVVLTGGAAIDYGARLVPVVPRWMARLQLEWLFRFLLEPVRMFNRYIVGNPTFLTRVLFERLKR